jgi:3-hydroxypropanoate dehydrogenase
MLDAQALDAIFLKARTHNAWLDRQVDDALLHRLYDLLKWGPTAANAQPARLLFLRTRDAKQRLRAALSPGNLDKTMAAPVVAIVAYDTQFHEHLPQVFPHNPTARSWFEGDDKRAAREASAFRNGTLQGAYLIVAARALGLDCGPMSGFDAARVDAEFFPDGRFRTNFLCNLGYGDPAALFDRSPRLPFETACQLL